MFKANTLLITGGTGTFGNAVLRRFLSSDLRAICIFSRDEKKQDWSRYELGPINKTTKWLKEMKVLSHYRAARTCEMQPYVEDHSDRISW